MPGILRDPVFRPSGAAGLVTKAEVEALREGLGAVLAGLEASLVAEVFAETLPLVGDRFTAAFDAGAPAFRYIGTVRTAAREGLATLTAAGPFTPAQVAGAINTRLSAAGFNAGSLVTVTTNHDQVQLVFITNDSFANVAVPIANDFGLPHLDLDLLAAANAVTAVSAVLHFTAGLDATGFYLETTPAQPFTIKTTTTIPTNLKAPVWFGKLPFRLDDDPSPRSSLTADFALTLRDPDGSGKIRLAELPGTPDLIDGTVSGQAALSLAITSDLPATAALPKVRADLALTWDYANPEALDPDDENGTFGSRPTLSLNSAGINVSSFFKSFATRVLRGIGDVTRPLDPLISILTAEIPLLSDLGSEAVTVLDVAGAAENQVAAIEGLAALSALSRFATEAATGETIWMNQGSYLLQGADLRTQPSGDLQAIPSAAAPAPPADMADFLIEAGGVAGLEFPLLANGNVLADLLLGRPTDLFSWRSEEIKIEADFQVFYPVLGPIGVTLGGRAGVKTQFGFGFDTQGVFDYAAAGAGADAELLFNGFYAMALDAKGDPFTGISLYAGITAGVEANVVIASVGVEGDITAEIGMYLDDLAGDELGRIRGHTIRSTPFEDLFYAAGSLSAGLRVYVEVGFPPFSVGYDWESPRVVLINFDSRDTMVPVLATPEGATLRLNVGARSPLRLHGDVDDRAEEFEIASGAQGIIVGAFDAENTFTETITLITAHSGERGDLVEIQPDVAIPVRFHGGEGRDFLSGGAMPDELHGEAASDVLRGRGGNDRLYGGGDNDELIGGAGADILDGGPGEDTASWTDSLTPITIDLRTGTFGGEAGLDTQLSIERYKGSPFADIIDGSEGFDGLLSGGDGDDTIRGHGGADLIEGGSGDDSLLGGAGNDLMIGGHGADVLDGGDGIDTLSYLAPGILALPPGMVGEPVTVNLATGQGTRGDAAGDGVAHFEILLGSGVPQGATSPAFTGDDLTGSDQGESIHGMGGADLIRGGGGNDLLYGDTAQSDGPIMAGFDADTIHGDAGDDTLLGQWDSDKLYGGDGTDLLEGGPGSDELDGGTGNDSLLGGEGDDHLYTTDLSDHDTLDGGAGYNRLTADYSDKTSPLLFTVGQANAHTFPGGDHFSNIQTLGALTGGSGGDVIRLAAQEEPYLFDKIVNAGGGDDLVIADHRGFYPTGGQPRRLHDSLHGGEGVDTISFAQSTGGVTAHLGTNALSSSASGMSMSGFENIIGTEYGDHLTGDAGPNIFQPLSNGRANQTDFVPPDRLYGGEGVDTLRIDFSRIPLADVYGVVMSGFNSPSNTNLIQVPGFQGVNPQVNSTIHSHSGIERFELTGGDGADYLKTAIEYYSYPDVLHGGGGNDVLHAGHGDDLADGGEGDDVITAAGGNDTAYGGEGNDSITAYSSPSGFDPARGLGSDLIEGGPGDDFVYNGVVNGIMPATAHASSILRLDGGSGYDSLTADFSNKTAAVHFDQNRPCDLFFSDGSWIRGFERLMDFYSGAGDDVLIFTGREDNEVRLQAGNDIVDPGVGRDDVNGGDGDDLLILDFSVGDGPGVGPVMATVVPAEYATQLHRFKTNTSTPMDLINLTAFERIHLTGSSQNDDLAGLTGNDIIKGGLGDDTLRGFAGSDWLDGGPGADRMDGSSGNDTYIVDHAADVVGGPSGGGTDTVRSSVDFTLPFGVTHLTLTGGALQGTGNSLTNTLAGNVRNNTLRGEGGNDTLDGGGGAGEVDRLHGGANADTFVLGDGNEHFYDDGSSATPGHGDYAIVEDFAPSKNDRLRLTGSLAQYFLGTSPLAGLAGTAVYHDSNANGVLDNTSDELVAILLSTETLIPDNTLTSAIYPAAMTPGSAGLTAPPVPSVMVDGSGPRSALTFTITEPMPAGTWLKVEASTDMGGDDPWYTIADKNGAAAWAGTGEILPGTPVEGRVTVTVKDVLPLTSMPRRFLRLKVTAP